MRGLTPQAFMPPESFLSSPDPFGIFQTWRLGNPNQKTIVRGPVFGLGFRGDPFDSLNTIGILFRKKPLVACPWLFVQGEMRRRSGRGRPK